MFSDSIEEGFDNNDVAPRSLAHFPRLSRSSSVILNHFCKGGLAGKITYAGIPAVR